LKPENILLTSLQAQFEIKLIDFGLAQYCEPDELIFKALGTAQYMAPEVLIGKGYGIECDLWSIGVILYFLLSGMFPFKASDKSLLYQ